MQTERQRRLHHEQPIHESRRITCKSVAILGPRGAGKTTWLERFTDAVRKSHSDILSGAMLYPIDFSSNKGPFRCTAYDVPFELERSLIDPILFNADGIIFVFDLLSSRDTFLYIRDTYASIKQLPNFGKKPVLLCGNKVDAPTRRVRATTAATFARGENFSWYFEISALANHRIVDPFVFVARVAEGLPDLQLINDPSLALPDMTTIDLQERHRAENSIAAILRGADNVVPDEVPDDYTVSLVWQRAFIQEKRDLLRNFVGKDDDQTEE